MTKTEEVGREQLHLEIIDQLHNTFIDKNADYGNSFGEMWQEDGFVVGYLKLTDKYLRVKRLRKHEAKVTGETMKDTLLDLANYAIMCLVELELEERKRYAATTHSPIEAEIPSPMPHTCAGLTPGYNCEGMCEHCDYNESEGL